MGFFFVLILNLNFVILIFFIVNEDVRKLRVLGRIESYGIVWVFGNSSNWGGGMYRVVL